MKINPDWLHRISGSLRFTMIISIACTATMSIHGKKFKSIVMFHDKSNTTRIDVIMISIYDMVFVYLFWHGTWWRHQMETFSALLAICAGNSPVPGEFPAQRPVTRSFDVFFDLRLNKPSSKQLWGWWFETLSSPLWRHCNDPIPDYSSVANDTVLIAHDYGIHSCYISSVYTYTRAT